ncbi:hypothetical protein RF11_10078 [Thelohanellus kitauei]|uniref:Uncharacterized protein n=1 Tax=Thelohanellus kitauei TaxID=669202 RepID=A0A0C2M459_THEKT|nr:hypothetical protein RF11_10078 [Thelohanellus kitauei]
MIHSISRKSQQMNANSLDLKVRLYCDTYLAPGFPLTGDPKCPLALCMVLKVVNYMNMRLLKCRQFAKLKELWKQTIMQDRNGNIMTSTDKINALQKNLIWKKHAAEGNVEMFSRFVESNHQDILPLILNTLLAGLS